MSVAGTYDCTVKSPMGDQNGSLTIVPSADGASFSGSMSSGMMGSMDIADGAIEGNTLKWKMSMTAPMPMDLECEATIAGDELTGSVKAGMFGTMDFFGTRAG